MRILLIEDDVDVATNICEYFQTRETVVDWAQDGLTGLHLVATAELDLVLLDLGLPGMDGLDLARNIRQSAQSALPMIMLTARDTLQDKLAGFGAGADDYLVKPFSLAELDARVQALMARSRGRGKNATFTVANLSFDPDTLRVTRAGQSITLSRPGYVLLEVLMRNSGRVIRKHELEHALWGDEVPDSDALRYHIHVLRKAVDAPFDPPLLHTIPGIGYRLCNDEDLR